MGDANARVLEVTYQPGEEALTMRTGQRLDLVAGLLSLDSATA